LKHAGAIWAVAFSPDGQRLASAGLDRVVKVWEKVDAQTWTLRHTLHDPSAVLSVAFSPDGQRLAWGGTDSAVKVWELPAEGGENVNPVFQSLRGHRSWIRAVAFSLDGQYLASGSQDGTVKIWETPPPRPTDQIAPEPKRIGVAQ
jgi:WD40 repeat protein